MNIKEIKEMINLMNENNLVELEIEKDGMRIRLKKITSQLDDATTPILIEKERVPKSGKPKEISPAAVPETTSRIIEIKAPMVGTFYRAPSPEAPAFAEAGQVIEPGQVICIIEAMKLMNEIKSEIKGRVVDVLVENAEPVEYGQPMFLIEPL